jgi:hypothetical protein
LEIQRDRKVQLQPGETLQIKLTVVTTKIFLQVNFIEKPVTPVPEAAYALLRRQQLNGTNHVECIRFAWSPEPTRIELVCAEDLRTEVVRRRAVFHWQDSARPNTLKGYAMQKITQTGSTYFPKEADFFSPNTAQIAEARNYIQQRWKPPADLKQTLEYSLLIKADGTIQQRIPLSKAAGTYLEHTGLPLPCKPFISPIEGGSQLTILVVLSPDGTAQAFGSSVPIMPKFGTENL